MVTAVYIIQPFVYLYNFVFNDDFIFIQSLVRFLSLWFKFKKLFITESPVFYLFNIVPYHSFKQFILSTIEWHSLN